MKNRIILAVLLLAGSSGAMNTLADSHQGDEAGLPPQLSDVWVVTPRDGHHAEFEAALREHIAVRRTAGDPRNWDTYAVVVGDSIGTYVVRHCCFEWPDQDAYLEWSNGTELQAHWNDNVHPHVADYRHYMDRFDWQNSHWPAEGEDWNYVGVTRWNPKPGEGMTRYTVRKKMSEIAKENGWDGRWLWINPVGGATSLVLATPFKDYADMAPPETSFYDFLVKHTSDEEAASMLQTFEGSFWSSEYVIFERRRDLSTPAGE